MRAVTEERIKIPSPCFSDWIAVDPPAVFGVVIAVVVICLLYTSRQNLVDFPLMICVRNTVAGAEHILSLIHIYIEIIVVAERRNDAARRGVRQLCRPANVLVFPGYHSQMSFWQVFSRFMG